MAVTQPAGAQAAGAQTGSTQTASTQFVWDNLGQYKAEKCFLDGYPDDQRTFFSPRDDIHGMLVALLGSAQHSIVVNMFGYDDDELKKILASWNNNAFGNSIAIGTSSVHNAISHLKIVIVDGVYTVKGSTNWSLSGEEQQDNELSLSRNAVVAAETRAILDLNHDFMLKQMGGTKLNVASLLASTDKNSMPPLPPPPPSVTGAAAPAARSLDASATQVAPAAH
jgi:phosphatidylserine/phosphatidylglycerophosphate/cardiolipin synthase-like enzyme